jgi:hypothetical protein
VCAQDKYEMMKNAFINYGNALSEQLEIDILVRCLLH